MTHPVDVWVHGASAGDLRAVNPFVRDLKAAGLSIVISATTRSGRQMAHRLYPDDPFERAPLLPGTAAFAMSRRRPRLVVFEYLELWPGWIRALHRRGTPSLIIDGRISAKSLRARPVLRRAAARVTLFCAQSVEDAENARRLGFRSVRHHGNGKHDGAQHPAAIPASLREAVGPECRWVVGSLQPEEEAEALGALARAGGRAVIAPRYLERVGPLLARARALGVPAERRSRAQGTAQWIVLDTMGELSAAYGLGDVAVIGGTFCRREGQNLVEAAAWNRPIVHGPRIANVRHEAAHLQGRGATEVGSWDSAFAQWPAAPAGVETAAALVELAGANARNVAAALELLGA